MSTDIRRLPIDLLFESPFNPRKQFDEVGLQELATDIKAQGRLLQPLLVRPRVPELFQQLPDAADTAACGWELVFGHRRLRAAKLAGLTELDCLVQQLTDLEVKRAQISENLQRRDVHAIEEAEGFRALMFDHGVTAEQLIEQTGKSRSYIYGRLKLLQAIPAVRNDCLAGKFGSEVALLIARLRHPKLQERALKAIDAKYYKLDDGGAKSFRQIRELLAEMFTLDIKGAVFPPEDAELVPSAGVCSSCTKLSGNAPEFADLADEKRPGPWPGYAFAANPRLCTDPVCWDAKHKAHLVREAEQLRAEGKTVVDGNKARAALSADGRQVKGAYISLADAKAALKAAGKKEALRTVLIQDQRTGKTVQAVASADLKLMGVAKQEAPKKERGYFQQTPAERAREEEQRTLQADRHDRLLGVVADKLQATARTTLDLDLLTAWAIEQLQDWCTDGKWLAKRYGVEHLSQLKAKVPELTADEKGALLVTIALLQDQDHWLAGRTTELPVELVKMTDALGIEPALAMMPLGAESISTPSPAARADEGAGADAAPAARAELVPLQAWPFPKPKDKIQKVDAGGAAAVERAEAGA